jgi:hypothetical protein
MEKSSSFGLVQLASLSKELTNKLYQLPTQPQKFYETVSNIAFVQVDRQPISDCTMEWPNSFEKFSNMVLPQHKELMFTVKPILPEELSPPQPFIARLHFPQPEPSQVGDNILNIVTYFSKNTSTPSLTTSLLKCYEFLQTCLTQKKDIFSTLEGLAHSECIWNKDRMTQGKRLFFDCLEVPPYLFQGTICLFISYSN